MMDEVSTAMDVKRVKTTSAQRRIKSVGGYIGTKDGEESHSGTESCRDGRQGADCQEHACGTATQKQQEAQQTVQQYQAAEEARTIAAKEAAVDTSREGGCREEGQSSTTKQKTGAKTTAEVEDVSRRAVNEQLVIKIQFVSRVRQLQTTVTSQCTAYRRAGV